MGHKNNFSVEEIIKATRYWVKSTVIHYNLCPFANKVYESDRLSIEVSNATTQEQLLEDSLFAIQQMLKAPREEIETVLLVHPQCMTVFSDYNDFLGVVDVMIDEMELSGVVQVASFHPDYCFADCSEDDASNYTNRSPYPMLHLLREESISDVTEEWLERGLNIEDIPQRNIETLRKIGNEILVDQLKSCYK